MVIVPLYDTLGAEAITYIVNKGASVVSAWTSASLLVRFSDVPSLILDSIESLYLNVHLPFYLKNVVLKITLKLKNYTVKLLIFQSASFIVALSFQLNCLWCLLTSRRRPTCC